jgi:hypothetical protein
MRPSDSLVRGEFDVNALPIPTRNELKERFFSSVLPVTEFAVEKRNAIQDEHSDFFDAIRQRRSPRVTGIAGLRAARRRGTDPRQLVSPSRHYSLGTTAVAGAAPCESTPLPQSTQRKAA